MFFNRNIKNPQHTFGGSHKSFVELLNTCAASRDSAEGFGLMIRLSKCNFQ